MAGSKFVGQFTNRIDGRHRVFLPKKLLKQIYSRWGDDPKLSLVYMGFEKCLALVDRDEWDEKRKDSEALPWVDGQATMLRRLWSFGEHVKPDDQGRIAIPPFLRKLAEIGDEVMFIGCDDYLELWDPKAAEGMLGQLLASARDLIGSVNSAAAAAAASGTDAGPDGKSEEDDQPDTDRDE